MSQVCSSPEIDSEQYPREPVHEIFEFLKGGVIAPLREETTLCVEAVG